MTKRVELEQITVRQLVLKVFEDQFSHDRFTINQVERLIHEILGWKQSLQIISYKGERLACDSSSAYTDGIHRVLKKILGKKDVDGHRIYYHNCLEPEINLTWFHRDLSTPDEQITFGKFIMGKGKELIKEGKYLIEDGLKRKARETKKGKNAA